MKFLSSLLLFPHGPKGVLKNKDMKIQALEFAVYFLEEIMKSINLFYFNKNLVLFDAHIGDTLCQVRAYKTILTWNKYHNLKYHSQIKMYFEDILDKTKKLVLEFKQVINSKHERSKKLGLSEKLESFLNKNKLIFDIPEHVLYLTINQILARLTIRDEFNIPLTINHEKINNRLQYSKSFARRLVRHLQSISTDISCRFIGELISDLPEYNRKGWSKILPFLQLTDNYKRKVLPCYLVAKFLFLHLIQKKIPILIITYRSAENQFDKIQLLFGPTKDKDIYELQTCPEQASILLQKPCFIVTGKSVYKEKLLEPYTDFVNRFKEAGVINILLANMAKHPQYSATEFNLLCNNPYLSILNNQFDYFSKCLHHNRPSLENLPNYKEIRSIIIEEQNELNKIRELAEKIGCCIENQSLFLATHIYSDFWENNKDN